MSDREKARKALQSGLLESIERKQEEVRRETEKLRRSLMRDAYVEHDRSAKYADSRNHCRGCGGAFVGPSERGSGETIVEYVDDDGRVVAAYHPECAR